MEILEFFVKKACDETSDECASEIGKADIKKLAKVIDKHLLKIERAKGKVVGNTILKDLVPELHSLKHLIKNTEARSYSNSEGFENLIVDKLELRISNGRETVQIRTLDTKKAFYKFLKEHLNKYEKLLKNESIEFIFKDIKEFNLNFKEAQIKYKKEYNLKKLNITHELGELVIELLLVTSNIEFFKNKIKQGKRYSNIQLRFIYSLLSGANLLNRNSNPNYSEEGEREFTGKEAYVLSIIKRFKK